MVEHSTDISVSARFSELPRLLEKLAAKADQLGIPADASLRLQLMAEELFTNTIRHGYGGDNAAMIVLKLGREGDLLHLRYEDEGVAFDPTAIPPKADSNDHIGGLGISLIRGLCKDFRYKRRNSRNLVDIDL